MDEVTLPADLHTILLPDIALPKYLKSFPVEYGELWKSVEDVKEEQETEKEIEQDVLMGITVSDKEFVSSEIVQGIEVVNPCIIQDTKNTSVEKEPNINAVNLDILTDVGAKTTETHIEVVKKGIVNNKKANSNSSTLLIKSSCEKIACLECGKLIYQDKMSKHVSNTHETCDPIACEYCGIVFIQQQKYRIHRYYHYKEYPNLRKYKKIKGIDKEIANLKVGPKRRGRVGGQMYRFKCDGCVSKGSQIGRFNNRRTFADHMRKKHDWSQKQCDVTIPQQHDMKVVNDDRTV